METDEQYRFDSHFIFLVIFQSVIFSVSINLPYSVSNKHNIYSLHFVHEPINPETRLND